ncbi:hypothetical protein G4D61_11025 [Bacillus ginsengihumi]|uniref:Copper resistance protein D domain-containing protein n=2 Tax=Heyndrickxia ginsengihumi TaxID=363870 RepID=A0A6M0PB13_9BACI|nr:hypothetical protein [Heyndrickxia ginsengihumi]NEY20488.1 hypothetical protein [Heyndrickxia ginsengihumi]
MHHIFIFFHVLSALLLGSFIVFPFIIMRFNDLSLLEQRKVSNTLLFFVKVGEISLIVLLFTGTAMLSEFGKMSASLWVTTSSILLFIIGALLGMMHSKLKALNSLNLDKFQIYKYYKRLRIYSWITMLSVVLAILVMTNPEIL